jgi:hypothetical protein
MLLFISLSSNGLSRSESMTRPKQTILEVEGEAAKVRNSTVMQSNFCFSLFQHHTPGCLSYVYNNTPMLLNIFLAEK